MKFNEFISEAQDNGVMVCRVSSGHSFYGEVAHIAKLTDSYATVKTESGKRVRVNDVYGKTVCGGKFKDCFIACVSRANDDNFFKCAL